MPVWPMASLRECAALTAGFAFKSSGFTGVTTDIHLVKGENIGRGQIQWDISKHWPVQDQTIPPKYRLSPKDVVIAMDRPWVSGGLKWAFIRESDPPAYLVQRVARLRANAQVLDQDFLRFLIGGPGFEGYIKPITTGVNVPHISGDQILAFKFPLPPLAIQCAIASVLSIFENLIDINRQRIDVLDEMARRAYRDWFVHFRFPGHQSCLLADSPLGRIPREWNIRTIGDLCERVTDGAHHSPRSVPTGRPMASSKDMHSFGLDLSSARHISIDDYALLERQGCRPQLNDVLVTKDGANYCKNVFVHLKDENVVLLSSIAILRPRSDVSPYFLSESLKSQEIKHRLKLRVSGAAIPRIILADFKQFPLMVPPPELFNIWHRHIAPTIGLCVNLVDQMDILRRTRDLLLPRLMSGQLSVAEAKAVVP